MPVRRHPTSYVAYAVWGSSFVFLRHPHLRGLYMKTHPCVLHVACPKEDCRARAGEPCRSVHGMPKSETHVLRRRAYARKARER